MAANVNASEHPPLYEAVECIPDTGSLAWIMVCISLAVLQIPGVGFVQIGMIRRKNSLAILMHSATAVLIVSALWFLFVFSLTFSGNYGEFIGDFNHGLYIGMSSQSCFRHSPEITTYAFATFQMMFAIASAGIVILVWAENVTYLSWLVFTGLWLVFVYMPYTHWMWGQGWLQVRGALDWSGGLNVNVLAGVGALVVSFFAESHVASEEIQDTHYNIPYTLLGGILVLLSWEGLVAGAAYSSNGVASLALTNVHVSAASSAFLWLFLSWWTGDYFHLSELITALLAGTVGISAGAGYVLPWHAFIIGSASTFIVRITMQTTLKAMRYDDQLNLVSLQAGAGITGALLVGFFATKQANPDLVNEGVFYAKDGSIISYQIVAVLVAILWSAAWSTILFLAIKFTIGTSYKTKQVPKHPDTIDLEEGTVTPDFYKGKAEVGFGAHPVRPAHRKPLGSQYWNAITAKQDPPAPKPDEKKKKKKEETPMQTTTRKLKDMGNSLTTKFSMATLEANDSSSNSSKKSKKRKSEKRKKNSKDNENGEKTAEQEEKKETKEQLEKESSSEV